MTTGRINQVSTLFDVMSALSSSDGEPSQFQKAALILVKIGAHKFIQICGAVVRLTWLKLETLRH